MDAGSLAVYAAVVLVPVALAGPFTQRDAQGRRAPFQPGLLAFALGLCAAMASVGIQRATRAYTVGTFGEASTGFLAAAHGFLIVGPLDEGLRAIAVLLPMRSRALRKPYDAMRVAAGSALGFATLEGILRTWGAPVSALAVAQNLLDLTAHVALTSIWGFALGRERRRRLGGPAFTRAFVTAVVFSSVTHYLTFGRGPSAMWAALPLVLSASLVALVARRDLLRLGGSRRARLARLLPLAPPTMEELEHALLRRPDRPLMIRWLILGALVTTGVLTAMFAAAIAIGHGANVDFSAVDQDATFDRSAPPLVLIGTAMLGAFPVSGFLIARASRAQGVLEPALAAAVAIVGLVVLLGLAAPVAVVFGLALGPVAFALACAGAWAGLER